MNVFRYIWSKYGILGTCLAVSIALHLAVLFIFGTYTLFRYYFPDDGQFDAVPFAKKQVQMRTITHRVQLQKKPPPQARIIRRIAVNKLSSVNLPAVPKKEKLDRKFEVSKSFLEGGSFGNYDDLLLNDVIFGTLKKLDFAFEGKIYRMNPGSTEILKTWPRSRYINTLYTKFFDVPYQSFSNGFPILDQDLRTKNKGQNVFEWFAINYNGRFYVRNPGEYQFRLHSDDGAYVYIDNSLVVSTPGVHPEKRSTGSKKLSEGLYRMRVEYWQGPRFHVCLRLYVKPPGATDFKIFNLNDYLPPAGVKVPD